MSLPILETAKYELTLPSQDTKVSFRPFLVKEEKLLLMALESKESKQITNALKSIVDACTFGTLNVASLPVFDLEYIFLQIRAKSVGEIAKLKVKCPDDNETFANVEVDLSKVEVQVDDAHTNVIEINDKVKMVMKYPTIDSIDADVDANDLKTEQMFDMIAASIYQIYDGETVHNAKDYKKEELNSFIESLSSKHFEKVQVFFQSMPKLQQEIEVENPKTKVKSKMMLQGIADFFVSPSHTTT
jgi:hypothetical protein